MATPRESFIETTARLLEHQGYHATGLNQIVQESGAPKGSLYYYFPDGKEGLTAEVIERIGASLAGHIRTQLAQVVDPAEAIDQFMRQMAAALTASDCRGGGPLATVALETAASSERLRTACRDAYRSWQRAFADKLEAGGYPPERAARLGELIIALLEGAIILCRTERSAAPLERLAEELRPLVAKMC
jgi:TetR/AcrR family transcriptional regulator, lmrAB and yxaGH operons repressor